MEILIEKYGKKDCCLCERADRILKRIKKDYPVTVVDIDIAKDKGLYTRFKERIPLLFINGKEEFIFKFSELALKKRLDQILEKEPKNKILT